MVQLMVRPSLQSSARNDPCNNATGMVNNNNNIGGATTSDHNYKSNDRRETETTRNPPQAYANENEGLMVHEQFMQSFRPWHLLDPSRPWLLVPSGSFGGYFDWVPAKFRLGPWSTQAVCYLSILWYVAVLVGCSYYNSATNEPTPSPAFSATSLIYPSAYSMKWSYHLLGCAWMIIIIGLILFQSPAGYRAWSTYTVLSWTILTIRHGLCAALPWYPDLLNVVELLRFPCALSHTVVFVVWNFVLMPYLSLVVFRDDPLKRRNFVRFCTSFRLLNLHGLNIFLCYLNIGWASPRRRLVFMDLYLAAVWVLLYMTFYLCVLDRLGVHLYPIFSPRLGMLLVVNWSSTIGLIVLTFFGWRRLLQSETD